MRLYADDLPDTVLRAGRPWSTLRSLVDPLAALCTYVQQVNGYRGGDDLESMRNRTAYDLAYLRSWSLSLDVLILLRTAKMLILGDSKAF